METATEKKKTFGQKVYENRYLLIIFLPVLIYYLIFAYGPMLGLVTAFQNYSPFLGITGSKWVGLKNFTTFFNSEFAFRVVRNTLSINALQLIFGFPAPIIFAVLLNEIKFSKIKGFIQTVSYLPNFISLVVVVGIMQDLLAVDYGIVNRIILAFGGEQIRFMNEGTWFQPLFTISGIWQYAGWNAIIFIAAIAGIDQELYESASLDGASRFQKAMKITIPCISDTIIILLILQIGRMMSLGFEKVILMYNTSTYEYADVISSYVYRIGMVNGNYSLGAAVGLFNSVFNCVLLVAANSMAKKFSGKGLF